MRSCREKPPPTNKGSTSQTFNGKHGLKQVEAAKLLDVIQPHHTYGELFAF